MVKPTRFFWLEPCSAMLDGYVRTLMVSSENFWLIVAQGLLELCFFLHKTIERVTKVSHIGNQISIAPQEELNFGYTGRLR